jgi:hypothetical protein
MKNTVPRKSGFPGWRARARPVAHSQTAWVTQATFRVGRPGRAQKFTGETGVKERRVVVSNSGLRGGGFEGEAELVCGYPSGAQPPPVDEEAAGLGRRRFIWRDSDWR